MSCSVYVLFVRETQVVGVTTSQSVADSACRRGTCPHWRRQDISAAVYSVTLHYTALISLN